MRSTPRRRRSALAVAALAFAAVIGVAAPASAHTQVSPAAPEPGSTVTTGPVTVAISTTEPVLEAGQRSIVVKGPDELYYGDGCTEITSGTTLSSEITLGEPGEYTVVWTVVAEDGHQQSSTDFASFTFTWAPDDGQQAAEGSSSVPECGSAPQASEGATAPDSSESDASQDDAADSDGTAVQNEEGWGDIGWIVAAIAILFVAAVVVIMLVVRRSLGADDESPDADGAESETGERAGAEPEESGERFDGTGERPEGPGRP